MDEDKYHGHIPGQTLSRPSALRDGHAGRPLEDTVTRARGAGEDAVRAAAAGPGGREGERGHASAGIPLPRMS